MHDTTTAILVVCRANQARSPLVAELLTRLADHHLGPGHGVEILSAGVAVSESAQVIPHMQAAARQLGVDLAAHRARALDPGLVRRSQLIITMTETQRTHVSRLQPLALAKAFTLKELIRIGVAVPSLPLALAEKVQTLHDSRATVAAAGRPEDVGDPDGRSLSATVAIAKQIANLTDEAGWVLFSARD